MNKGNKNNQKVILKYSYPPNFRPCEQKPVGKGISDTWILQVLLLKTKKIRYISIKKGEFELLQHYHYLNGEKKYLSQLILVQYIQQK